MQNALYTQGNCLFKVPLKEPRQDLLAGGKALTRSYVVDSSSKVEEKHTRGDLRPG